MVVIYLVEALASAGKTHKAVMEEAVRYSGFINVLIVQPSLLLINEWHKKLTTKHPKLDVTKITSETHRNHVTKAFIDHTKAAEDKGQILFVTHAAFLTCPFFHNKENWLVITDEEITNVADISLTVPKSHNLLTDNVELEQINTVYSEMKIKDKNSKIKEYAANTWRDAYWGLYENVMKRLVHPHWSVYVNTRNYSNIRSNAGDEDKNHQLMMYAELSPSIFDGFNSVIIMGAKIKQSIMYAVWQDKVTFKDHPMSKKLKLQQHENGDRLTIKYLFDRPFSKTFRDSADKAIWKQMVDKCEEIIPKPFLYVANNDVKDALATKFTGGTQVSTVCQGLNAYSHIHNMVYLAALNPQPAFFHFLESRNIHPDEVKRSMYLSAVYQGVMRTSLRDLDCKEPVTVIVSDRDAAQYLQKDFPGSKIQLIPGLPLIPWTNNRKIWRTPEDRMKATNEKIRILKELGQIAEVKKNCMTLVPSIYSKELLSYDITSNDAFINELRVALDTEVSDKHKNILITPTTFKNKTGYGVRRTIDDAYSVNGIWLDNDRDGEDSGISPDQFRKIFPNLRFVAFSTYSRGGRYRIFIPTTQVMTVDADEKIKQQILHLVAREGYTHIIQFQATPNIKAPLEIDNEVKSKQKGYSGFDSTKLNPAALFYIPCRPIGSTDAFFTDYEGEVLDPVKFLANPITSDLFDVEPEMVVPVASAVVPLQPLTASAAALLAQAKQVNIDAALDIYRRNPNDGFPRLLRCASKLRDLGLHDWEIRNYLNQIARNGDARKRINQIFATMNRSIRNGR